MSFQSAQWIWLGQAGVEPQSTMLVRRVFDLAAVPAAGTLAITASHIYRVWVNGVVVGRGPDRADPRFPFLDRYDIRPHLRAGRNVVVALVHYFRTEMAFAERNVNGRAWCLYGGPPGFAAEVVCGEQVLATDETWEIRRAAGWRGTQNFVTRFATPAHEVHLGEFQPALAAALAGEEDAGWQTPQVWKIDNCPGLGVPRERETPMLERRMREPLTMQWLRPSAPQEDNSRAYLWGDRDKPLTVQPMDEEGWIAFDFEHTVGGFPCWEFECEKETGAELYCCEGRQWHRTDLLTLPAGASTFEPLDWRGGRLYGVRFAKLEGWVKVRGMNFAEMAYPFARRGDFKCSEPMWTDLWRMCRDTAGEGVKDHPMDCLTREQALWITDINEHGRIAWACFGDARPFAKALRQALELVHEDGVVPVPGPVGVGYKRTEKILPWSEQPLTLAMSIRDLYMSTGCTELAAFALPRLEKIYAHFARYEDARGLLQMDPPGLPGLVAYCGWAYMLKAGVPVTPNAEYVMSLAAAGELAGALGRVELARQWGDKAEVRRRALQARFWDAERKLFLDGEVKGELVHAVSLTTNTWAALAGAVPVAERGGWGEALRRDPDLCALNSPFDAGMLLHALAAMDMDLQARELIEQYYGSVLRGDNKRMPEFWTAGDPTGASRSIDWSRLHPYGCAPAYVFQEYVLGVRVVEPGYRRVRIAPRTLGLSAAQGRVPTPGGEIGVDWEKMDHAWRLEISLPRGVGAELVLPRLGWNRERLVVDGREVWRAERWTELKRQMLREPMPMRAAREVRHALQGPGRFEVELTAE